MPGPKFVDTTVDTAMAHPWSGSVRTRYQGIPLGIDLKDGQMIPFDPWWLKANGFIKSTTAIAYGPLDHGKSALLKVIAWRLALFVMGFSLFRLVINDRKPEGTDGEYGALSRAFGCVPYTMRNMQVNPFERRLFLHEKDNREVYELGLLEIAQLLCEYEFGPQSEMERYALRVALYEMLHADDESVWSPERLQRISGSLQESMKDAYHDYLDDRLIAQTEMQMERVEDEGLREQIRNRTNALKQTPINVPFEVIRDAGIANAARLGSLLHGPTGSMFGVKHSIYDMLTQRAVDKDWRGMTPLAETLMHILETRIKTIAGELHRTDLLPHMEISDELHRSMDNLMFAQTQSYFLEIARSMPTFQVYNTHTPNSIRKGDVGSELYNLGNKIMNNTALAFYGAMPNEPALLSEIQAREQLSASNTRELARLDQYVFATKFGPNEGLMFLHPVMTAFDHANLIDTNAATDNILRRPSILSPDDMRRFAAANGITYVGQ